MLLWGSLLKNKTWKVLDSLTTMLLIHHIQPDPKGTCHARKSVDHNTDSDREGRCRNSKHFKNKTIILIDSKSTSCWITIIQTNRLHTLLKKYLPSVIQIFWPNNNYSQIIHSLTQLSRSYGLNVPVYCSTKTKQEGTPNMADILWDRKCGWAPSVGEIVNEQFIIFYESHHSPVWLFCSAFGW